MQQVTLNGSSIDNAHSKLVHILHCIKVCPFDFPTREQRRWGVLDLYPHERAEWVRGYDAGQAGAYIRKADKSCEVFLLGYQAGRADRAIQFRTAYYREKLADALAAHGLTSFNRV